MTNTLTLSNGQRILTDIATGEVIDASNSQVTSIRQGASMVLSDGRNTTVVPGHISSRTDVASEIWLRMLDGRERPFRIANVHVPMRAGHRVTVLWGAPEGVQEGWNFGARNHTTGVSSVNLVGAIGADLKQWKLKVSGNSAFMGLISAGILLGAALAFIKTDSSSRLDYAVVGGILGGLFSAMLGIPLVTALVVTPKARRLLPEIEQFANDQLARRDSVAFARSEK